MRILKSASFFIIWICVNHGVMADYLDPTGKTNVNVQTNLFKESVGDVQEFEGHIDEGRNAAIGKLNSPNEGVGFISGKSQEEVESNASSLSAINANDLQDKGTKKMLEENIIEEIYIDETKPLNIEHQKDAKKIADASDLLLAKLMDLLKALDIDCKTVKGNKEIEPEYHLEIKKEKTKDTVYNKTLCEELRNKYNCTDELKVKCTRTGPRYGEWQYKTIRFGGAELHNSKVDWGYARKRCRKEWDWLITPNHPKRGVFGYGDSLQVDSCWRDNPAAIIADARVFIAGKVGAGLDQIREDIVFPPEGRGIGNQFWGVGRWRHPWEEYEFGYWYRDIYQVCELWDEDWTEECKLQ